MKEGVKRERQVAVPFTSFGKLAEMFSESLLVGDQLIVHATIRNNKYTDSKGIVHCDYNFEIQEVEFGSPGATKRKKLAETEG